MDYGSNIYDVGHFWLGFFDFCDFGYDACDFGNFGWRCFDLVFSGQDFSDDGDCKQNISDFEDL